MRVGREAPVFLAAVLEYLCAEIHDMAAGVCMENGKKRIKPRHITEAIKSDFEFSYFLSNVEIVEEERFSSISMVDNPVKLHPYRKRRRRKKKE